MNDTDKTYLVIQLLRLPPVWFWDAVNPQGISFPDQTADGAPSLQSRTSPLRGEMGHCGPPSSKSSAMEVGLGAAGCPCHSCPSAQRLPTVPCTFSHTCLPISVMRVQNCVPPAEPLPALSLEKCRPHWLPTALPTGSHSSQVFKHQVCSILLRNSLYRWKKWVKETAGWSPRSHSS